MNSDGWFLPLPTRVIPLFENTAMPSLLLGARLASLILYSCDCKPAKFIG